MGGGCQREPGHTEIWQSPQYLGSTGLGVRGSSRFPTPQYLRGPVPMDNYRKRVVSHIPDPHPISVKLQHHLIWGRKGIQ